MPQSKRAPTQTLHLALQGGGTQGAFTWGVLDRLLEDETLTIGRISGTSAGALNGAALATGWARGGRAGARQHLAALWQLVAAAGSLLTWLLLPLRKPGMGLWDDAMPILSPYQVNPLAMAPLRGILGAVADEDALRAPGTGPSLYVNAVHVQSGHSRVFGPQELSIDAVLASACAPLSYQAVTIDGEAYWDGSYAGNPMLWPLYEDNLDCDVLLVELTPLTRPETPMSAKNILNRINEIASINGLVAELRALDSINRNVAAADIRLHLLSMPDRPAALLENEPSIKRTVGGVLFELLRRDGYSACDAWLAEHRQQLGRAASVDLHARYLAPYAPRARTATRPKAVA